MSNRSTCQWPHHDGGTFVYICCDCLTLQRWAATYHALQPWADSNSMRSLLSSVSACNAAHTHTAYQSSYPIPAQYKRTSSVCWHCYTCTTAQGNDVLLVGLSLCICMYVPSPFACSGVLGRGSFQRTSPQVLLSSPSSPVEQQQTQAIPQSMTQGVLADTSDTARNSSPHTHSVRLNTFEIL